MPDDSPVMSTAADLIERAAGRASWRDALRVLGLAATDENVESFRRRASALGVDTTHLLSRRRTDQLSTAELQEAARGASCYAEVLSRLGLRPGGKTYAWLEQTCAQSGIVLPPRPARRPPSARCSDDAIRAAFIESRSMADLLRRLGIAAEGGNYRSMRRRLAALGLDADALPGQAWSRGLPGPRRPVSDYLRAGRPCSPGLARRLIAEGVFTAECSSCRLRTWRSRAIPLELDHINGDAQDNQLHNLRLLCPNCHALTPTYRGRNIGRRRRTLDSQPEC